MAVLDSENPGLLAALLLRFGFLRSRLLLNQAFHRLMTGNARTAQSSFKPLARLFRAVLLII
jgi:hypothetical protein